MRVKHSSGSIPLVSKEIVEIKTAQHQQAPDRIEKSEVKIRNVLDLEKDDGVVVAGGGGGGGGEVRVEVVELEKGKRSEESDGSGGGRSDRSVEAQNIGWGRWYGLKELEIATRGFSGENVIGEGGYGIVYRGVLQDGSVVAVKNLLNNKYVKFQI